MRRQPRIILLDFDGVLRSGRLNYKLDPDCVSHLNALIAASGAKIVVSSAWRGKHVAPMQRLLTSWGVRGKVIGVTPHILIPHDVSAQELEVALQDWRGREIQQWLTQKAYTGSFVILDDEADMGHLLPQLVLTNTDEGLTARDVGRALAILTGQRSSVGTPYEVPAYLYLTNRACHVWKYELQPQEPPHA